MYRNNKSPFSGSKKSNSAKNPFKRPNAQNSKSIPGKVANGFTGIVNSVAKYF